ncbi:MAG TPA: glycosyltransferase [Ktedonobacterales bacterium]|jgi:glycosyltransferase involved in cell wall biosynthesis|nr:glycosyltransferase [Ktedonobacterales bacterium]
MSASSLRRILFVSPHSDPLGRIGDPDTGGQCVYERELARALAATSPDVAVDVFTRWYGTKARVERIAERAMVYRIPCGGDDFIRKEDLGPVIPEFVANARTQARDLGARYDLVHGHYWDGGVAGLALARLYHTPFVFTSHSLGKVKQRDLPDEALYHYETRILAETEAMSHAQLVISLSKIEEGYIRDLYGLVAARVAIVPGGVDTAFFSPQGDPQTLRQTLGMAGADESLVLALGRLDPRKGFPYLVAAAPEVIRRVEAAGRRVRFFISAGGREPLTEEESAERTRIEQGIAASGRTDCFTLVSKLDLSRVPEYYSAADVFVAPSPYEPFGLVIIEAMACGAPVIATNQGGPPEIISEGKDGYLVHPSDTSLLAERMTNLLLDDMERASFRFRAREKAVSSYSWGAIARRIYALYAGLSGLSATEGA